MDACHIFHILTIRHQQVLQRRQLVGKRLSHSESNLINYSDYAPVPDGIKALLAASLAKETRTSRSHNNSLAV